MFIDVSLKNTKCLAKVVDQRKFLDFILESKKWTSFHKRNVNYKFEQFANKSNVVCSVYSAGLLRSNFIALENQRSHLHISSERYFHASQAYYGKKEFDNPYERALEKRKKEKQKDCSSPFIRLVDENDQLSTVNLNQAKKIAQGRKLRLIKLEDPSKYPSTNLDVYKLMDTKEYMEALKMSKEEAKDSQFRGEKLVTLKTSTGPNDINIRVDQVHRLANKNYRVKVVITGKSGDSETMNKVFEEIKAKIEESGEIGVDNVQTSGSNLKFYAFNKQLKEKASSDRKMKAEQKRETKEEETTDSEEKEKEKTDSELEEEEGKNKSEEKKEEDKSSSTEDGRTVEKGS